MAEYNDLSALKKRYSSMSNDELISIMTKDFNNYTPEALEAVQSVLVARGITDIEIPIPTYHNKFEEKDTKPIVRIVTRLVLYFFWIIISMFLIVFHGSIKDSFRPYIVSFIENTPGIANIRSIVSIYGVISALITVLLFYIIIKGFLVITKETKSKIVKSS